MRWDHKISLCDTEIARFDKFMDAAKGLTARQTAVVMRLHGTVDVDWTGCAKGQMARAYAQREHRMREGVIRRLRAEKRKGE